jgi:signal transduction histidine kinase
MSSLIRREFRSLLDGVGRRTWRTLSERGRWVLAWRLMPPVGLLAVAGLLVFLGHPIAAVASLATAVLLSGRFAWPITALLAAVVVGFAEMADDNAGLALVDAVALIMMAYAAGRRATTARRSFIAAGVAAAIYSVREVVAAGLKVDPHSLPLNAIPATLLILLPAALGTLNGERARSIAALRDRNLLLERAQQLGDLRARMHERARIAGEMHDLIGHRLSLIALHAGALEMRTRDQSPELSEQAHLLRTTSRTALDELRAVLGILRLDGGGPEEGNEAVGTRSDVAALVAESAEAGLTISLVWSGSELGDADITIRRAVHRIVRESLTNVHKHAPGASARLAVVASDRRIAIELRNAWRPTAASVGGTGLGLVGLRERARLAGGTYAAGVDKLTGEFVVTAELPTSVVRVDGAGITIDQAALAARQMPRTAGPGEDLGSDDVPTRSPSPMSKVTKIVLSSIAGIVVLACAGGAYGIYYLTKVVVDDTVSAATYQQIAEGEGQDHVRQLTGGSQSVAKEGIKGNEPAMPAGATCDYDLSKNLDLVYRFCFVGGKLVQKDQINIGDDHK